MVECDLAEGTNILTTWKWVDLYSTWRNQWLKIYNDLNEKLMIGAHDSYLFLP